MTKLHEFLVLQSWKLVFNHFYLLNVRKLLGLNIHIGCCKLNAIRGIINHLFKILLLLSRRRRLRFVNFLIIGTIEVFSFI